MNTFVILGLVVLLMVFLVRSRRRTASGDAAPATSRRPRGLGRRRDAEPAPSSAGPSAFGPSSFDGPSFGPSGADRSPVAPFEPTPLPAPAPAHAAAPAAPSDWAPAEMIVEPGWPLPGEIAGGWPAGPAAPAAPVHAPVAETAATLAPATSPPAEPEAWEMPAMHPVAPSPTAEEPGAEPIWAPDADTGAASPEPWAGPADAPPAWSPEAAPTEDIWLPAEASTPTHGDLPVWEPEPQGAPVAGPAPPEPEPVAVAPVPTEPEALVVEPEPVVDEPFVAEAPVAEPEPEPDPPVHLASPVWEPVAVATPEPAVATALPEPPADAVVPAPVAPAPPAADEIATLLVPALAAVRPLVRVSDHAGVTPRMLVVMRALAERPLSVGEQAALLGVSRPVVADIAARLETLGLTRRERDERDRRRVRMALTDRGRRVCGEAVEVADADAVATALAALTEDDRTALARGLRALAGDTAAS